MMQIDWICSKRRVVVTELLPLYGNMRTAPNAELWSPNQHRDPTTEPTLMEISACASFTGYEESRLHMVDSVQAESSSNSVHHSANQLFQRGNSWQDLAAYAILPFWSK